MRENIVVSILIPTFNREKKLKRTLHYLEEQTCDSFEVFVCDNCSNYNVYEILDSFSPEFKKKVHIKRNPFNIGADSNIVNLFLNDCKGEWLWPLSDDDIVDLDAIKKILRDTDKYNDAGWLDYADNEGYGKLSENIVISSLEQQIDILYPLIRNRHHAVWGNLVYLSNKVYKKSILYKVLPFMFRYAYTHISTVLLLTKSLEMGHPGIVIDDAIVQYDNNAGLSWNARDVLLGCRTFFDIEYQLDETYLKRLYEIIIPETLFRFSLGQYLKSGKEWNYPGLGIDAVYSEMKKNKIPHAFSIERSIICSISRSRFLYNVTKKLFPLIQKLRMKK